MYKKYFVVLCLLFLSNAIFAQTGIIRVNVFDGDTGEALIGANVVIAGTTNGNVTDLDGKAAITGLEPGNYNLQISYVSYQTKLIQDVKVNANESTVLTVKLESESVGLDEVVVQAEAIKSAESALLTVQKKSSSLLDGLSSEQFNRTGDSDAAAAMQRVTGVSVQDGKYVFVRGLGDRYSKTALNNAEVPGLDPNKNTVQMDLFPSNLIDNMIVYKTFSPELPASFSGGFVNISTKDFPDRPTLQVSGSLGYNTNATFQDGLTHNLGNRHWYGMAPDERRLPEILEQPVANRDFTNPERAELLDAQTKALNAEMEPFVYQPSLNHSLSVSYGDQKSLFGKPFGYIASLSYSREYKTRSDASSGRFILPGTIEEPYLDTLFVFNDQISTESVLWGGILNASVKLSSRHKVGINLMHNQSGEAYSAFQNGPFPYQSGISDNSFQIQARSMMYMERFLSSGQLKGESTFGNTNNPVKLTWSGTYTLSRQNEPDLRFFNNTVDFSGPQPAYDALTNNVRQPSHYFREMQEDNMHLKMDLAIPFTAWNELNSKLLLGGSYLEKERNFDEKIFEYRFESGQGGRNFNGDVEDYFADDNLGVIGQTESGRYRYGLYIRDNTLTAGGSYDANESVPAAYASLDFQFTPKLKANFGARYEQTDIEITNNNESLPDSLRFGEIKANDIFPAINMTYEMVKDMNLRFAYSKTIARPTFRELARFASFEFMGDFLLVGNPDLERTLIDNIDFRWEFFPNSSDLISFSAFYKRFENPIERAISPTASTDLNIQFTYRNVPEAQVWGLEFEMRKTLDFIADELRFFKIGTNLTLLDSKVDIAPGELLLIRQNNPEAESTRVMFGQAPYIINAYLNYSNSENLWSSNLNFNVLGDRLSYVGVAGTPNVFEKPRPTLDFNIGKGINENWTIKLSANNLLDAATRFTHDFKGIEYDYQSFRLGRTFSLGVTYLVE